MKCVLVKLFRIEKILKNCNVHVLKKNKNATAQFIYFCLCCIRATFNCKLRINIKCWFYRLLWLVSAFCLVLFMARRTKTLTSRNCWNSTKQPKKGDLTLKKLTLMLYAHCHKLSNGKNIVRNSYKRARNKVVNGQPIQI